MHPGDFPAQDNNHLLAPPNAMTIVALERQTQHEKIVRLRALREAAEAEKAVSQASAPFGSRITS